MPKTPLLGPVRAALLAALLCAPAFAQNNVVAGVLRYRGFTVDLSQAQDVPDPAGVEASVEHQIDIVAGCGASPKVLAFFRSQEVFLKPSKTDGGGRFTANSPGVALDDVAMPFEKPILLHELLHAFHWRVLPKGFQNPDILLYYGRAKGAGYPEQYQNAYFLSNAREFFAVTGSLYLWGHVSRPPYDRAMLKAKQPFYYAWLGKLFGVQK
ncbi:MAG TPA: hypothetical protein VK786_04785 [bacterium]|jgi:hypothetical protein|nr:hypothetical protein [bacterium]